MSAKNYEIGYLQFVSFEAGPGWLAAAFSAAGLFALALPRGRRDQALEELAAEVRLPPVDLESRLKYVEPSYCPADDGAPGRPAFALADQVKRYFAGQKVGFTADIDWSGYTPFQKRVLETVRGIPYGAALTYGEVARLAGRPGAARAVGGVMRANRTPLVVPCHRVVAGGGALGGFGGGLPLKRYLLELEGWCRDGS